MKNRFFLFLDELRSSYWFIPSLLATLAGILSIATIRIDENLERDVVWVMGLTYVNSPEGARAVLSTIASSMITVAGVVFSLTMVVLSLTSQQYGSLVIRNFIRDRGNQFVLGIFTATFIYCLLILRTIRGMEDNTAFVPHISLLVGLALAILSLAVLIYFIHHVSESIQASAIVTRISNNLNDTINDLFPAMVGHEPPEEKTPAVETLQILASPVYLLPTPQSGYLQVIEEDALLQTAIQNDIVIQLNHRPGEFVVKGELLLTIAPQNHVNDEVIHEIESAFVIGSQRTQTQDIEFIFMQLIGIGVRALSPGINDPFTAIMCIDRLGEALCLMMERQPPSRYRYDDHDQLRVIAVPMSFEDLFAFAFDQIRYYGREDIKVMVHLMQMITSIAICSSKCMPQHQPFLENYAEHLFQLASQNTTSILDKAQLDIAFQTAKQHFEAAAQQLL